MSVIKGNWKVYVKDAEGSVKSEYLILNATGADAYAAVAMQHPATDLTVEVELDEAMTVAEKLRS